MYVTHFLLVGAKARIALIYNYLYLLDELEG